MAIILPQGRFNNSSDKYIRDFIAERCRVLAVVGLHGNVFKPHTGTKTSVLFVQKWDEKLCPRRDDYPIFFATMREPSKDNSGEKILATRDNKLLRDSHNHTIVKHDLFNHDGLTRDGIAEAFIEFAKREGLSFFDSSSFDEEKYRRLSEELECTENFLSELNEENRLDAKYFSKIAMETDSFIKSRKHFYLKKSSVVSGPFGSTLTSSSYLSSGDIAFVRIENIRGSFRINTEDIIYISAQDNSRIANSQLFTDDIILSKVGNIGFFARVDDELRTCNISENNIGIKLSDFDRAKKHFVLTYLNSKFGQINVDDVCKVPIPEFSKEFNENVSALVLKSDFFIKRADENYHAAEKMLSAALGLENFKPTSENVAIKSFSASFSVSGRLDAEFYQPKYDDIKKFMTNAGTVGELCKLHDKNFMPHDKTIYKYIELANVETNGNISMPDEILGEELPTRARRIVKAGQVIISSIEGSLQNCALITDELDGALCSTGFFVIDSENFNAATLLVLFKSKLMQDLMRQQCTGTILTAVSKENFLALPLPIIELEVQEQIAANVAESFRLRGESEKFLFQAKQAVEMAIESGEEVALKFLGGI